MAVTDVLKGAVTGASIAAELVIKAVSNATKGQ